MLSNSPSLSYFQGKNWKFVITFLDKCTATYVSSLVIPWVNTVGITVSYFIIFSNYILVQY